MAVAGGAVNAAAYLPMKRGVTEEFPKAVAGEARGVRSGARDEGNRTDATVPPRVRDVPSYRLEVAAFAAAEVGRQNNCAELRQNCAELRAAIPSRRTPL